MATIPTPEPKAQALLAVIAEAIVARKMSLGAPETLLTYAEAVEALTGESCPAHAGAHLQKMGLRHLSRWTESRPELPKVDGLIVERKTRLPAPGFRKAHGHQDDPSWEHWWRSEADRAIEFDWSPYLEHGSTSNSPASVMREDVAAETAG